MRPQKNLAGSEDRPASGEREATFRLALRDLVQVQNPGLLRQTCRAGTRASQEPGALRRAHPTASMSGEQGRLLVTHW